MSSTATMNDVVKQAAATTKHVAASTAHTLSNLVGEEPSGSWINQPVQITYRRHLDRTQHAFKLTDPQTGPHSGSAAVR